MGTQQTCVHPIATHYSQDDETRNPRPRPRPRRRGRVPERPRGPRDAPRCAPSTRTGAFRRRPARPAHPPLWQPAFDHAARRRQPRPIEQVVEDEMGVIKEGMATDKEFLSSATETIKKCFVKFSGRLEKLQQKKAKFEERIEEVALQEKHAAAAVKQLDDAVTHAKDEVAKMASLAKDFGSKNLEVTLSGGPTVDTTKNVQKAKEYAKEY